MNNFYKILLLLPTWEVPSSNVCPETLHWLTDFMTLQVL